MNIDHAGYCKCSAVHTYRRPADFFVRVTKTRSNICTLFVAHAVRKKFRAKAVFFPHFYDKAESGDDWWSVSKESSYWGRRWSIL